MNLFTRIACIALLIVAIGAMFVGVSTNKGNAQQAVNSEVSAN